MTKYELYDKLKKEGIFWSYDNENIEYIGDKLLIEHTLIWADVPDILNLFKVFTKEEIIDVWNRKIVPDERYFKLNIYLGYIYFDLPDPYKYIEENKLKFSRYEKIRSMSLDI